MALYCTNLRSSSREDKEKSNTVWIEWDFANDKVKSFEVEVYTRSYVKRTWVLLRSWSDLTVDKVAGSYKTWFTVSKYVQDGSTSNPVESYYFKVKPNAIDYTYTEYDADGNSSLTTVPWFDGGWAKSESYVAPTMNAVQQSIAAEFTKCEQFRENARSLYSELSSLPVTASTSKVSSIWTDLQDAAGSCKTSADSVISLCSSYGYTTSTSYEMKWATSYKANANTYLANGKTKYDSYVKTAADKAKEAVKYRAAGDDYWSKAGEQWDKAKSAAANKNDSAASKYYNNAADYYWKAAQNYGWSYEITGSSYDIKWQNESAYWWNVAYLKAGNSLTNSQWTEQNLKAMGAKSATPTVSVGSPNADGHVMVTIKSNDKWSNRMYLQRSVNGGSWGTIHTVSRTVPKGGGAWSDQKFYDATAWVGNSYRYRAYVERTVIPVAPASAWSATASYLGKPAAPSNFQVSRVSNSSVTVSWVPEGHVSGEYVIRYTNIEGRDKEGNVVNAWVAGIADNKIQSLTVPSGRTSAQIDGLAEGRWYFRMYRRNATGDSAWAKAYNGNVTINVLLSNKVSKLVPPQAVKAALVAATSVRLTWADVNPREDGATYTIEYTTNKRAWADNITDEIRTVKYGGADGLRYTVTGLSQGKRYYFRVAKVRGTEKVWGYAATESRYSMETEYVDVPAVYSEGVTVPSGLAVEAVVGADYTDGRLTWTDPQGAAETYDIQYTNVSGALEADDMGVINAETLGSWTANNLKTYTVKNLTPGFWQFRVRKLANEAVSYWSNTVSLEVMPSGGAMASPAGLYAEAVSQGIQLTWTDVQESGAQYEVWSTTDTTAYETNAMGHVTITGLGELASQGDNLWTYTLTDLKPGVVYLLRVRKNLGESFTWASTLRGHESYRTDTEASVELSVDASGSVSVPQNLAATGRGPESMLLTWDDSGATDNVYVIQYTTDTDAYTDNAVGNISQEEYTLEASASEHRFSLTGLEAGALYYVRVRKRVGELSGAWTDVVEAQQEPNPDDEEALAAPTVAATQAALTIGETAVFSWIHNGATEQTQAQVRFTITDTGGASVSETVDIDGAVQDYEADPESLGMSDGYSADWQVRTMGTIVGYWSPWSAVQRFSAYEAPVAEVAVADGEGNPIGGQDPLESMPLNVEVTTSSASLSESNAVIAYGFQIEVVGEFQAELQDGTSRYFAGGEVVYAKSISANDEGFDPVEWVFQVPAGEVQLFSGATYAAVANVVTATGMRAQSEPTEFSVYWGGAMPQPSVRIEYDDDAMACAIYPWCNVPSDSQYSDRWLEPVGFTASGSTTCDMALDNGDGTASLLLVNDGGYASVFVDTDEIPVDGSQAVVSVAFGEDVEITWSDDGAEATATETIHIEGVAEPEQEHEEDPEDEEGDPERREPSLTPEQIEVLDELGWPEGFDDRVDNENQYPDYEDLLPPVDASGETLRENTVLDIYRVLPDGSTVLVAYDIPNDGQTGAVDVHPNFSTCTYRIVARDTETTLAASVEQSIEIPMEQAVIQWNESWESNAVGEIGVYTGERIVTPYGVKVSESYEVESVLRAYVGRRSPVSYYGTQLSHEESIETSFVRYLDGQELAAARRLASWFGDCYVREPSGTGFWANVKVGIGHEHNTDKQNVTFSLTKVEGGA